jgi:hypothetical protein
MRTRDVPSPGFEGNASKQATLCDDTLATENCAANSVNTNTLDIGMRKPCEDISDFNGFEVTLKVLEF